MTEARPHYRVLGLHIRNYQKIEALDITPDRELIEVTGDNANGKTSALNALWAAFSAASIAGPEPIRDGAEKATIRVDLGDIVVTRTFKRGRKNAAEITDTLTIDRLDGEKVEKPQVTLNGLMGKLSMDPTAFLRMKPDEQRRQVQAFVPGYDFTADVEADKADFAERTVIGRLRDAAAARAEDWRKRLRGMVKVEPVDVGALMAENDKAIAHNEEVANRRRQRDDDMAANKAGEAQIEMNQARMETLRKEILALEDASREIHADIEARSSHWMEIDIPEKIDRSGIQAKLDAAQDTNRRAGDYTGAKESLSSAENDHSKQDEAYAALTRRLEDRKQARAEAIASAEMPVDGLEFGEDGLILNGHPFEQASTAERVRTSVAIAMAANPQVRIIRLEHGNDIGQANMAIIAGMARQHDWQVWVERLVPTGAGQSIEIVEGKEA
jgi:hypothetical protein